MNKSTKYSFCRICEAACGLIIETDGDRIIEIRPNPDHVATRGYACKKGLKFTELEHSPDRLLYPMKRTGDSWERIGWQQALAEIGGKIRMLRERYGPDSIAMYGGNGLGFGLLHPVFAQGFMTAVVDSFPGSILTDEILTPGPGQVRALICAAGNPAISLPDASKVDRAFRELELLVCIDIFRTVTGNYAHYLLPGVTFLQRPDINFLFQSLMGIADRPSLTYSDAIRQPEEEQMEEHRIYLRLARAAGLPFFGSRLASALFGFTGVVGRIPGIGPSLDLTRSQTILSLLLKLLKAPSIRTLRKNPNGIRLPDFLPESFLGKRVYTEDGRIDLAPEPLVTAAQRLEEDYRVETETTPQPDTRRNSGNRLRLITMREPLTHNSYFRNGPSFVPPGRDTSPLHINPEDAERLGLTTGGWAEVRTEHGSITVPVNATPDMATGSVGIPWGWGHQEADGLSVARKTGGANVNHLTPSGPDAADPVSGMARLTGIDVSIRPGSPPNQGEDDE